MRLLSGRHSCRVTHRVLVVRVHDIRAKFAAATVSGLQRTSAWRHHIIEIFRCLHALGRHANHALGAPTSLWGGITHPRLQQTLGLQAIDRRIQWFNGALPSGRRLDLFPNRSTVSLVSRSGGRGDLVGTQILQA